MSIPIPISVSPLNACEVHRRHHNGLLVSKATAGLCPGRYRLQAGGLEKRGYHYGRQRRDRNVGATEPSAPSDPGDTDYKPVDWKRLFLCPKYLVMGDWFDAVSTDAESEANEKLLIDQWQW
ncbi:hypothetical protein QBC43DRAFT_293117 [Cladorrhinum sp. PSN259]|nr:hypothetical protein QBC43DRAFT_293117 [Cladorrhinum sp. PSN259]